jgi:CSLREA domain-containing protein
LFVRKKTAPVRRLRPGVEVLEDRFLLNAYTVNVLGDLSGSNSGNGSGLTGDLRYCINQAILDGQADTIAFDPTVFSSAQTITLNTALSTDPGSANVFGPTAFVVSGSANITITGPSAGVTLDAGNAERLFALTSGGTLTLQDLTLQHGLASGSGMSAEGGAIYSQGDLTLNQVCVLNNTAQGSNDPGGSTGAGGGLYVAGGTATLTNDTLDANLAQGGAGGPGGEGGLGGSGGTAAGGGLYVAGGTATLTNDTLDANRARGGAGGTGGPGFGTPANPGILPGTGGLGGSASGGGLYMAGGTATLTNDTLNGNLAQGGVGGTGGSGPVVGPGFAGGGVGGTGAGGGVEVAGGTATLTNDTLAGNRAQGGVGGTGGTSGWGVGGDDGGGGGSASGGGLHIQSGSTIALSNTLIAENTLTAGPGGAAGNSNFGRPGPAGSASAPDVSGSLTASDHDLVGDGTGSNLSDGVNGNQVGTSAHPIDPLLGPLQDNGGPTQTMALLIGSPALNAADPAVAPATDQRGVTRKNTPDIGAFDNPHALLVTTLADANGSAVGNPGSPTSLREAIGFADQTPGANFITFALSGTITLDATQLPTITGELTITGPTGGLTIDAHNGRSGILQVNAGATVGLTGLTLANGTAYTGGAIDNEGSLTLTGCTLSGNRAAFGGGVLNNGTLALLDSTLVGDRALDGGAIDNNGAVSVTNSTLAGNTAGNAGGAIANFGTLSLTNSTLSGNSASNGGGVYNSGTLTLNNTIVGGNTLLDGTTPSDLAGDANLTSGALLTDPGFETPSLGPSAYAYDPAGSPWTFSGSAGLASYGSLFDNPPAPQGSQVAFLQGSGSISQSVDFAAGTYVLGFLAAQRPGNQQTIEVLVDGEVVATITPSGSQFALYTTSPFTVTAGAHTIEFVGLNPLGGDNTAFLDQVSFPGLAATSNHNLIGPGGADGLTNGVGGNIIVTSVAALGLGALGNYFGPTQTIPLLAGSPAIDAGANALAVDASGNPLTTDQRGLPRVSNSTVDIGAFEVVRNIVVTTLADEDNGTIDPFLATGASLREAINFANLTPGADTITITFAVSGTISLNGTQLPAITGDLTIIGPSAGLTIDAHGASGILQVSAGATVSLSGVTLAHGTATDGGCVYNAGTLTLTRSTLTGNAASHDGGGIDNLGTLTLSSNTLSGNSASDGGGIDNLGTLTLINSTLAGNSASGSGGGVFNAGTLTLTNATLTRNSAGAGGGIYSHYLSPTQPGLTTLNNSIVGGNTLLDGKTPSDLAGDANLTSGAPLTLTDPGFETPSLGAGAYAYDPAGSPWTFTGSAGLASNGSVFGNSAAPQGYQVAFLQGMGSISQVSNLPAGTYTLSFMAAQRPGNQQTFEVLVDGVVAATVTPSGSSFALYTTNAFTVTAGAHTIEFVGLNPLGGDNTAFLDLSFPEIAANSSHNLIGPGGSGGLVNGVGGNIIVTSVAALGLGALGSYGGSLQTVALLPGSPAIDAGANALAVDASGHPLTTDQRGLPRVGNGTVDIGAFEVFDHIVVTTLADEDNGSIDPSLGTGTSLREAINFANANPGADTITFAVSGTIYLNGSQLPTITDDLTIVGTAGGLTINAWGASRIFWVGHTNVALSGLTLVNGDAVDVGGFIVGASGGGIVNQGSLQITDCFISNCKTDYLSGLALFNRVHPARGGAILNDAGTVAIVNSTISGCHAFEFGGAIFNYFGTLSLAGSTLARNSTYLRGYDTYFRRESGGGGIFNWNGSTASLTNCTLSGNSSYQGGGIDNYADAKLTVTGCTLTGNVAKGGVSGPFYQEPIAGGGIFNNVRGVATITDSTFSGNFAYAGGGVANFGHLVLTNSTLSGNTAGFGNGGGLGNLSSAGYGPGGPFTYYHNNPTASLTGDVFSNNVATLGGGVSNDAGAMAVIGCSFTGNSAGYGAGINNLAVLSVSNSTLTGNSAGFAYGNGWGGGIFNSGTLAVTNTTISGNVARNFGYGGGIDNQGGLTLTNSTLSGNSTGYEGGGIFNNGSLTVTDSTLSGNSAGVAGGGIFSSGAVTLSSSTLTRNSTLFFSYGGGIDNRGVLTLTNSIVGGNTAPSAAFSSVSTPNDVVGNVTADSSHNLFGPGGSGGLVNGAGGNLIVSDPADLKLGPLADNGGPTQTVALLPGSPAINAGDNSLVVYVANNALAAASDPDFATPTLRARDYVYDPAGSPWTFTGQAGLASNGSAFGNPPPPQGSQVAFLQGIGSISQTFDLTAGTYVLGLLAAQRPGNQQTFEVLVDGAVVATITPSGSSFALYTTSPFTVTAGSHTIQFVGLNPLGGDNTAFLDQIQVLEQVPLTTDQRGPGFARIIGPAVDIGAFESQVLEQPPTVTSDQAAVTGNEGSSATNTGTYADAAGNSTVTLTASVGTVTKDDATGTWSWSYTPAEESGSPITVTITATDGSGLQATTTFTLTVNDALLSDQTTATALSSTEGTSTGDQVVGTFGDADPGATASDYTATIYWGDGSSSPATSVTQSGSTFSVHGSHTYAEEGTYNPYAVVTDNEGNPALTTGSTVTTSQTLVTETVADAALTDTSTAPATPPSAVEGASTGTLTVATFTDPNPGDNHGDFTATIHWGDGSSSGTVSYSNGTYFVQGSHSYGEEGSYAVTVDVTDAGGSSLTGIGQTTVAVGDAALSDNSAKATANATEGASTGTLTVASFTDANLGNNTGDFTATIHWGDGSSTSGSVSYSNGTYLVQGSHIYAEEGNYAVTVDLTDAGGSKLTAIGLTTVAVGDGALSDTSAQATASATEGTSTSTLTLASFTDANPGNNSGDLTATIHWGDRNSTPGTISYSNGTYSVSGSHAYAEEGSYAVTVDVSDDGGSTLTGVGKTTVAVADAALTDRTGTTALSAKEGASTGDQVVGAFSDADPHAVPGDYTATIYWGDGSSSPAISITQSGGTFSVHGAHTYAEEGTYNPYAVVTDNEGNPGLTTGRSSVTTSKTLVTETVALVAPTASVSGPSNGVPGQPRTFTFTASDPDATDQAAGFAYAINWGDGTTQTIARTAANGSGALVDHIYTTPATYTVKVTATEDGGTTSAAATASLTEQTVQMQGGTLAVGGTLGNDTIILTPTDTTGNINVKENGKSLGNFKPTDHILVYGQSGNDTIQLASAKINGVVTYITVPAFLYGGGTGTDTLDARGSTANNVLTGGGGKNTLFGGRGRDILIAGKGASQLNAGSGDDILIGGWTAYDLTSGSMTYDKKLAALEAVMAEWGSTDSYTTRVNDLQNGGGLNGLSLLNTSTVHDNGLADSLFGTTGSAFDWFLDGPTDVLKNKKSGEVVTAIS